MYWDYDVLFPSPCGVLMILIKTEYDICITASVSVPMRGFNDFNKKVADNEYQLIRFPSPCGVLMILIDWIKLIERNNMFPSPCGVLMILIR